MSDDKKDLTRIQDLQEFLHEDDPDSEEMLSLNLDPEDDDSDSSGEDLTNLEDEDDQESEFSVEEFDDSESDYGDYTDSSDEDDDDPNKAFEETESQWDSETEDEYSSENDQFSEDNEDSEDNEEFSTDFTNDFDTEDVEEEDSYDETPSPSDDELAAEAVITPDPQESPTYQVQEESEYSAPQKTEKEILDQPDRLNRPELVATKVENELESARNASAPRENESLTQELKQFGENYTYNSVKSSGNPAYSILVTEIPEQHHEDVLRFLREFQITGDDDLYRKSLEENMVLVSHIGEFVAISLANRFSRYGAKVKLAPSEIIHESPHYENESQLTHSSSSIQSSVEENIEIDSSFNTGDIIITTTSFLQGHKIHKYLGLVQDFVVLTTSELHDIINAKESSEREIKDTIDQEFFNKHLLIHEFHDKLQQSLEHQAKVKKGNAIIGLQYSYTTPSRNTYEITCTGTAVYALKIKDKPFYE